MQAECELGGRFSRCKRPTQHTCQYCGRGFCYEHTHYVEGHEAVCSRKYCVAKQEDMQVHLVYRERVSRRNGYGQCGEEGCTQFPAVFQCSLCQGHFCPGHLTERMYTFHDGYSRIERAVSVCARCWDRRKIWQRR